nr:hypothetical protein BaRGS_009794 [Batillaria attramentaria]
MNGNWDKRTTLGEMPLTPGDDFNITLSITNEQFHIVLLSHNDTTFGIPLVPGGRPDPPHVVNADVFVVGDNQDDKAHVECQQGYVAVPKGVSTEIRCQVTYKWTAFNGSCEQAEFFYPAGWDILGIPWPVADGWEMCVKGMFLADGQMTTTSISTSCFDLRNAPTLSVFKSSLKTFLFRKAYQ